MGANLWQLLLAPPARPSVLRELSSKSAPPKPPASRNTVATVEAANDNPPLGHFSHGTTYGYLAASSGTEYMRDWRLQSPLRVIEKVKAMLLAERTGAEWELLQDNEWEEEEGGQELDREIEVVERPEIEQTGVLVRPGPKRSETDVDRGSSGAEKEEGRGTSGWMKLKNR